MGLRQWWREKRETPTASVSREPVAAPAQPDVQECANCHQTVAIWHTYADGSIRCVECK